MHEKTGTGSTKWKGGKKYHEPAEMYGFLKIAVHLVSVKHFVRSYQHLSCQLYVYYIFYPK